MGDPRSPDPSPEPAGSRRAADAADAADAPVAPGLAVAKRTLRARAKAARAGHPPEAVAARSEALRRVLDGSPSWRGARHVAAFLSLPGEPDLRPALRDALARGVTVWLPRVASATELEFVPLAGDPEALTRGVIRSPFGIDEPTAGPCARSTFVEVAATGQEVALGVPLDLVLVPGLLFGRDGARLGYGRGYYDRVLAPLRALPSPRPLLIGVAFEGAILEGERIPMAAHDVRVDALLTERRVVQVVSREGTP